jgi:SAM-dependent methyltransferase
MTGQTWDAAAYDDRYRFVFERGRDVVDELAPKPGERVLDIGAGTAHLTDAIARAGAHVVGIDASAEMIERARAQYPHLDLRVVDARDLPFEGEFDAAFSNATLHWISPPERVASGVARALVRGARFVGELGGSGNCAAIVGGFERAIRAEGASAPPYGLYFPSIAAYARVLDDADFEVRSMRLFDRPTPLEGGERGLERWLRMFSGHVLEHLSAEVADAAIARAERELRDELFHDGRWVADYRRLRFEAVRR